VFLLTLDKSLIGKLSMPNAVIQQWNRIPKVYKGAAVGAIVGAAPKINEHCECR